MNFKSQYLRDGGHPTNKLNYYDQTQNRCIETKTKILNNYVIIIRLYVNIV